MRLWCLAALALLACQGQPVRNTNRGVLHLSVEGDDQPPALDLSFDAGSVVVGMRKELIVRATNVGVDPMTVLGVSLGSTGNGSWFVRDVSKPLSPGASLGFVDRHRDVCSGRSGRAVDPGDVLARCRRRASEPPGERHR
jgi:hypothetical protein